MVPWRFHQLDGGHYGHVVRLTKAIGKPSDTLGLGSKAKGRRFGRNSVAGGPNTNARGEDHYHSADSCEPFFCRVSDVRPF